MPDFDVISSGTELPGSGGYHFSLDIGTRTVVGVVARRSGNRMEIIDIHAQEYDSRVMVDGQIHDIDAVSACISSVKMILEQRVGISLKTAGIALAGRSLKTRTYRLERSISSTHRLTGAQVTQLELAAIGELLTSVGVLNSEIGTFHCVGYSVVRYELDGVCVSRPESHIGSRIAIDVLVTFLPKIVLDCVLTALEMSGLTPAIITLEPIAAVNVIIPSDIRQLNLAMIDLGAGTSDIAISRDGAIVAYGMVPIAGDELTESICDQFLVDFSAAESIKRHLGQGTDIVFTNILGHELIVSPNQILSKLRPNIESWATTVVDEIVRLNGEPPRALILIGGGSQIPELPDVLNRLCGIDRQDIGFRCPGDIPMIDGLPDAYNTPEFVTPIGIAWATVFGRGLSFIRVSINGCITPILNLSPTITLSQTLLSTGINVSGYLDDPTPSLTFELNGDIKTIRGTGGKPAVFEINGQVATLDTIVNHLDVIIIHDPEPGNSPVLYVKSLVERLTPVTIFCNDKKYEIPPVVMKNNGEVVADDRVENGCKIVIKPYGYTSSLLAELGVDSSAINHQMGIKINGVHQRITLSEYALTRDGKPVPLDAPLYDGDRLVFHQEIHPKITVKDVIPFQPVGDGRLTINSSVITIPNPAVRILMNGRMVSDTTEISDGATIESKSELSHQWLMAELLDYAGISCADGYGKTLVMTVNGSAAGFDTYVSQNAVVAIYWE